MNEDTGALIPALDPLIPEDVTETVKKQQTPLEDKDALLAAADVKEVTAILNEYIDGFKDGSKVNIQANDSFEVIGQKYTVAAGVAAICSDIIQRINGAQAAVKAREASDAGQGTA